MSLLDPLTTVLYVALSMSLLFLSGYGITALCLRDEDGAIRWVVMPIAGLALWVLVIENLGVLGLGTKKGAPLALLVMIALAIAVRLRMGPIAPTLDGSPRTAWGVAGLCLAVVVWPMLLLSHKNYIGFGNPDALIYFSLAEYFQHHGYREFPFTSDEIRYHPILNMVHRFQAIHRRVGEAYWVSSVASLLRSDPKEVLPIVHATAYSLIPLSVYGMSRLGFGLDTQQALLAMFLQGVNAVLALIYFQQLLPHSMGLTLLPLILGIGVYLIRTPRAGPAALLGLLLAGLVTVYPELLPFAVIPLGASLMASWRSLDRRRVLHAAILALLVMVALNPAYLLGGLKYALRQASGRPGGLSYFYANQPIMFPIYWGLTSKSLAYSPHVPNPFQVAQFALVFPVAAGLLGVAILGVRRLARLGRNTYVACLVAYALIGLGVLLFMPGYTYGFFKFLSYTQFLTLTALAVGLTALWRARKTDPGGRTRKLLAATLGGAYVGLNLVNIAIFGFIAIQDQRSFGVRGVSAFPQNEELKQLRTIRSVIDPDDHVVVNVVSLLPQQYLGYYLKDIRVSFSQPMYHMARFRQGPPPSADVLKDSYVLEARDASTDVVVNQTADPLWTNQTFALSRFPRLFASLVIPKPGEHVNTNWYALEYDGRARRPYRWVNNDAMIRVIGPVGETVTLTVELDPGPWGLPDHRTIDVFVNHASLQTVIVRGRTRVQTVPFVLPSSDTLLRLHIREDGSPLGIHSPLLALLLGDHMDFRKLNLKVYSILVRPVT